MRPLVIAKARTHGCDRSRPLSELRGGLVRNLLIAASCSPTCWSQSISVPGAPGSCRSSNASPTKRVTLLHVIHQIPRLPTAELRPFYKRLRGRAERVVQRAAAAKLSASGTASPARGHHRRTGAGDSPCGRGSAGRSRGPRLAPPRPAARPGARHHELQGRLHVRLSGLAGEMREAGSSARLGISLASAPISRGARLASSLLLKHADVTAEISPAADGSPSGGVCRRMNGRCSPGCTAVLPPASRPAWPCGGCRRRASGTSCARSPTRPSTRTGRRAWSTSRPTSRTSSSPGPYVYKLKKAVRFPFLDFGTPERRRALLRGGAPPEPAPRPPVYLDVVPITRAADGPLALDGAGAPVEHVVRMRRLPADRACSDRLVAARAVEPAHMDAPGRAARALPRRARRPAGGRGARRPEALARALARELAGAAPARRGAPGRGGPRHPGRLRPRFVRRHERCCARARRRPHPRRPRRPPRGARVLRRAPVRPSRRRTAPPGIYVFDCIEFSHAAPLQRRRVRGRLPGDGPRAARAARSCRGLRRTPTWSRAGRPGGPDAAALLRLLPRLRARQGRGAQGAEPEVEPAATRRPRPRARGSTSRSRSVTPGGRRGPAVVVCCGLSGSGKTALATALAEATGFAHLSTDVLRRQEAPCPGPAAFRHRPLRPGRPRRGLRPPLRRGRRDACRRVRRRRRRHVHPARGPGCAGSRGRPARPTASLPRVRSRRGDDPPATGRPQRGSLGRALVHVSSPA